MTKVQLTLTSQEADILTVRASQLGYNLTRYVKYLITKEAVQSIRADDMPTFPMSSRLEKIGLQALEDHKAGKTVTFDSIEELFEE